MATKKVAKVSKASKSAKAAKKVTRKESRPASLFAKPQQKKKKKIVVEQPPIPEASVTDIDEAVLRVEELTSAIYIKLLNMDHVRADRNKMLALPGVRTVRGLSMANKKTIEQVTALMLEREELEEVLAEHKTTSVIRPTYPPEEEA